MTVNYPDLLGAITGGNRLNLDLIQCAMTTRPDKVGAGQHFEVLFLIQNTSDLDIDVTVTMHLPERDHAKKRGMFYSKAARLLVGLEPAEVGYIILPASCSPKTQPGENYLISADVKVELVDKTRKPQRVRQLKGGGALQLDDLPESVQQHIASLKFLTWEGQTAGRSHSIQASFRIMPPGIASLAEFKPGWESLWKMRDYLDEYTLAQRLEEHLPTLLSNITSPNMFRPLLEATQKRFGAVYNLKTVEAVYIVKQMVLLTCYPVPAMPDEDNPRPQWPEWFKELLRLLFREPRIRDVPARVIAEQLYPTLLKEAVLTGFASIAELLNEDFGTPAEMAEYADELVAAVMNGTPLDITRVYLPLVMAGASINERVTMPRENVRETIYALNKAMQHRSQNERNSDNDFIFDLTNRIIDLTTASM